MSVNYILRDRAGVARWAHNPKVGCSNHSPATNGKAPTNLVEAFSVYILSEIYSLTNNIDFELSLCFSKYNPLLKKEISMVSDILFSVENV